MVWAVKNPSTPYVHCKTTPTELNAACAEAAAALCSKSKFMLCISLHTTRGNLRSWLGECLYNRNIRFVLANFAIVILKLAISNGQRVYQTFGLRFYRQLTRYQAALQYLNGQSFGFKTLITPKDCASDTTESHYHGGGVNAPTAFPSSVSKNLRQL